MCGTDCDGFAQRTWKGRKRTQKGPELSEKSQQDLHDLVSKIILVAE